MTYDCKIVIKEDKWNDNCFFNIYIKYKPSSRIGFYKKYFILNELRGGRYGSSRTLPEKLKWFNNLSMEEIKQMVINYIKNNQKEKSEQDIKEEKFQQQIKLAKEKVNKFTVKI
jgi:hypothetical protein